MKILLSNNPGLGDYILMNGASRYLAAQENVEEVNILAIVDHNKFLQITRMYEDEPKIIVHPEPGASGFQGIRRKIRKRAREFPDSEKRMFAWAGSVWPGAMERCNLDPKIDCWPELFYASHAVPFSARHEYFYIKRDLDREAELLEELKLPSEYAFCIDRGKRSKYRLTPKTNLPVFKPHHWSHLFSKYYIFDWMGVLEQASEIYTVDTSWMHLIKSMKLDKPKFYYNVRGDWLKNIFTSRYINDEHDNGWKTLNRNGDIITSNE
tara:strand:- start:575 stop:1372 length:798 start_codon:yes stop_codon:yes gene_type:complete